MSIPLGANIEAGILCRAHVDHDSLTVESVQNIEPITDLNQFEYKEVNERTPFGKGFQVPVGRIPLTVLYAPGNEGLLEDPFYLLKFLDRHPQYKLRPGRLEGTGSAQF